MGMFYARGLAGIGRRTHVMRGTDVARRIEAMDDDTVLIFRVRAAADPTQRTWSSPVAEYGRIGKYHEALLAVSKKYAAVGQLKRLNGDYFGVGNVIYTGLDLRKNSLGKYTLAGEIKGVKSHQQVGAFLKYFTEANPRGHWMGNLNVETGIWNPIPPLGKQAHEVRPVGFLKNNTHDHVSAVISELRTGRYNMQ